MSRNRLIRIHNPYSGELEGEIESTPMESIPDIVSEASEAFRDNQLTAFDRYSILAGAAKRLTDQKEEWAVSICRETGKPIRESRTEVDRAVTTLEISAQEALRVEGHIQACDVTDKRIAGNAYVHRVPIGVILAVTPFNFPLNIPAHKIGPALAAGNTVILKPSPRAPLASSRFASLFHQAGLPENLLQVVNGESRVTKALAQSEVSAVSFTGSSSTGGEIARWSAGKKLILELGGNDAAIVMEDADLEKAASAIVAHRFGSSGQRCTACKRVFIHQSVYQATREILVCLVSRLRAGDPMDETTDVGPLIDDKSAEEICRKIEESIIRGANVILGGERNGRFIKPALIENISHEDPLVHEETFGPVLPLVPFGDLDHAIRMVNSTRYGLQSAIFTNRIDAVRKAFREIEAGALIVNDGPGFRIESLPFGGVKRSGFGREGVRYAIEEFTTLKTLVM